ncbi:uncharacterized protein L203_105366 [Cryptococcus depauperatus CBS 7841]|uniref:Uncharacterized protein n=1 Tax=Cryptococcus depauperatus CBS 7841 TaxID=1295531 RepID=A0A1E3HMA8_9TREE|nr:hypothetical protein L203_06367 [Cryptococcus depauperatus CBS 7841]
MPCRSIYLAKHRGIASQRAHFALFIPNAADDRKDLSQDFQSTPCSGTVIHVVGEPVMLGYALEFKRNDECSDSRDLREMVFLGHVDSANLYDPPDMMVFKETCARAALEREATMVNPPPRGQNIRALIDGVTTRRCQEWTMELLHRLEQRGLISPGAASIAERHRDSPSHGIFGQTGAASQASLSCQQV